MVRRRDVSIHARRATSDIKRLWRDHNQEVSIHARRATSDLSVPVHGPLPVFQFTLVVRRATRLSAQHCRLWRGFNSRSSCDERPAPRLRMRPICSFNSRSSCDERPILLLSFLHLACFNSRSSCDERHRLFRADGPSLVSIHARRATSDSLHQLMVYPHMRVSIHARRATSDAWIRSCRRR